MKVSVVIPCYNCESTIEETLASIMAQTYRDIEIIAVDDGSRDRSASILERFKRDVKLVSQPNSGVSAARNAGVSNAVGDWIAFCDADDLWAPEKIEIAVSAINSIERECHVVFSDYSMMRDGVEIQRKGMMSKQTMFPVFREFGFRIEDMFANRSTLMCRSLNGTCRQVELYVGNIFRSLILGNVILPSALMVRREAQNSIGGFSRKFRTAEDTECFLRLARKYEFLYIDAPLITYRRGADSLLSSSMLETMKNGIRAVEINCKDDESVYSNYRSIVDRSLARKYARLGYFHLTEIDCRSARAAARTSLAYRKQEGLAWKVLIASLLPGFILGGIRSLKAILAARKVSQRLAGTSSASRRSTGTDR